MQLAVELEMSFVAAIALSNYIDTASVITELACVALFSTQDLDKKRACGET